MLRILVGAVALGAWVCSVPAQEAEPERARMRLVSEFDALVPGKTIWLGVAFDLDPGWHLYWNGQSDSGAPIDLKLELPGGYKAGDILWPAPTRHISPGDLLDHVYEKRVTLLVPVEVPPDAKPGSSAHFSAEGSWLVCKTVCLMGSGTGGLDLRIADADTEPRKTKEASLFAEALARVPKALPAESSPVALKWNGDRLEISAAGAKSLAFYPGLECAKLADLIRNGEAKGATLTLEPEGEHPRIEGVLEVRPQSGQNPSVYRIDTRPMNPGPSQPSNELSPRGG